ncbi:uncharacterized protein LOC111046715 [Nilaparvata lugens]|uniref:uncharacterized protein LOC111046715 n=1 Tax=Nilaparvata lugens TaxID=108931 RepID=UPI00193DB55F|nr:uncharacterized protein LOC111046715 [Nilaparvata lugens]
MMTSLGGGGRLLGLLLTLTAHGWNSQAVADGMRKAPKIVYHDAVEYFHSKQISNAGTSLLIGTLPKDKFEDSNTELQCVMHNSNVDNYYKEEYHLKVFETKRDYQQITEKNEIKYKDYFFTITKESWSCHKRGDTNDGIMMIINEYIGIREIFEIKYYDGIEVTIAYTAKGDRTAKVREIRFFKMGNTAEALRFEGTLYYQDEGQSFYKMPNYRDELIHNRQLEKKTIELDGKQVELTKEVIFQDAGKLNETVVHVGEGQVFRIGSPWTKVFGNSSFVSACTPEQGLNPFPFEFRPQVYDLQTFTDPEPREAHKAIVKIDAHLTDEYFTQYFISVREEVWNCIPFKGSNFLRIVNEVVGRIPVQKIHYYDGITEAHKLFLEENNKELGKKSIRFTEVKYVDPVTKEILKYGELPWIYSH